MIRRKIIFGSLTVLMTGFGRPVLADNMPVIISRLTAMVEASYRDARFNEHSLTFEKTAGEARGKAEAGDAYAQNDLGVAYILGQGVTKDAGLGVKWLEKAAEQSCGDAEYNLGQVYRLGLGVEKDSKGAVVWFLKGIEHDASGYPLAMMYATGSGVAQDDSTAAVLFAKDGDSGHFMAAYEAGLALAIGRGARQNLELSYYYFSVADRNKMLPEATLARSVIVPAMSDAQIKAAKKRFSAWRAARPGE